MVNGSCLESLEPEGVVLFLTRKLHSRVLNSFGTERQREEVGGLKVLVMERLVLLLCWSATFLCSKSTLSRLILRMVDLVALNVAKRFKEGLSFATASAGFSADGFLVRDVMVVGHCYNDQ